MAKKVQLQDLETGEAFSPITDIESVEGLSDKITELENKEDKDTIYDDTELRGRVEQLEEKIKNITPGEGTGGDCDCTPYDDTELRGRVEQLEKDIKDIEPEGDCDCEPYDDTELRERVEKLEEDIKNIEPGEGNDDVYTKEEIDEKLDNIIPGSIIASNYGETFEEALNNALAELRENPSVTTIDCTNFTGEITCQNRFVIDTPCTIKLGNANITMQDTAFFVIKSNNVIIEGLNRQADMTVSDGNATTLIMKTISTAHDEGYHIYSRGNKSLQFKSLTLKGIRSSIESQENNATTPIDGVGGIYIEKENPGTTEAGNTCNNIIIDNVYIEDTKAAAIYIDTPILSSIKNTRVSGAGGHGVYINGGTSIYIESTYVASANYAGFCLQSVTYATVANSCAETCGCGWWIRSCSNVTLLSPGTESTVYLKNNPWNSQYSVTSRYGKGLVTTSKSGATVKISDVPDDAWTVNGGSTKIYARGLFIGYGFVITGGKSINIFTPYAANIANASKQNAALSDIVGNLAYIAILGNARSVNVVNFGNKENSGSTLVKSLVHEAIIGTEASNLDFSFDSENTVMSDFTNMVTNSWTEKSPIYNDGLNSLIHSGAMYYAGIDGLTGGGDTYDDTDLRNQVAAITSMVSAAIQQVAAVSTRVDYIEEHGVFAEILEDEE